MAALVELSLQEKQAELDKVKAKANEERMRQAGDEFKTGLKGLERLGKV